MAGAQLQVPGGPLLEFERGLWSWKVTANGQPLRRLGRTTTYEVVMPDGSVKPLRITGQLNGTVEIDGHRFPIERPLPVWELVLCGLPLVLCIPGITGGILGFVLGIAGLFTNMTLARSLGSTLVQLVAILVSSALFITAYVASGVALAQLLRGLF